MARRRLSAAEYVERHDDEMRIILGELLENAAKASLHWAAARRVVRDNPDRALTELVDAEIALHTFIRNERTDALRVIDRASDLLDEELPETDDATSPTEGLPPMSLKLPGGRMNAAASLITEVNHHLFEATPRMTSGGPDVQVARRVHSRCLTRYQAIGLLLAFDQPNDAFALVRGLLGDSQRLQLMAIRAGDRMSIALGWMEEAVRDLESRAFTADAVGQGEFAAGIRSIAAVTREAIDRVQDDLGISRRIAPPDEGKPLANATGHGEDYLDYVIASDPAHGSLPTALWHDRGQEGSEGEPAGLVIGTNDPAWRNTVAERATRHMVRATGAMAEICALPSNADVRKYADEVERRLDAGELPRKD